MNQGRRELSRKESLEEKGGVSGMQNGSGHTEVWPCSV